MIAGLEIKDVQRPYFTAFECINLMLQGCMICQLTSLNQLLSNMCILGYILC